MIKIAILGCGRIASRHADLLKNGQIENAELSAVCDISEERATSFGQKYSVQSFTSLSEMIDIADVDLVAVCTPSGSHAADVIEVARHSKHVVVEKPMALTLEDADKMIAACSEAGVRLFVVKQNRYNLPIIKLKEALDRGRLGKVFLGTVRVRWCRPQEYYDQDDWRGTWSMDGGVLTNQASHHIDLLEWMLGEVQSVQAMSSTTGANIEVEDTAVVNLRFRNGALGVIEATTAVRPKNLEGSLSILGDQGSVEVGGFAVNEMKVWNFKDSQPDDENVIKNFSSNPPDVYGFGHREYYNSVVKSLRLGTPHLVDGLEGRKSLELINAIYESIETQKEVYLRFQPKHCRLGMANG